jgi:geranylgeranyl diphosphate synthase type I
MLSYFAPVKEKVARVLQEFLASKRDQLAAVNTLGPDAGERLLTFALQGKMVRACLVPLGWALGPAGGAMVAAPRAAITAGAAMELFQSGLLVHDDIMDRDLTRRGNASVFRQYAQAATRQRHADPDHVGEALGICAGDVAFFLAFEMLSLIEAPADVRASLLGLCARELTSVGIAQMQDVAWGASRAGVEETDIVRMYRYKTSRYSFSLPLMAGATLAAADSLLLARLESIGETIGVLFQVRDDELGLFGDEAELGKPVGSDVREGKKTLLYARLMARAGEAQRARLARIFGNRDATARDLEFVRSCVVSLGVRESLDGTCGELRARALALIDDLPSGSAEDRNALRSLLDFSVARRQ